ncbi:4Fe-4S binding protein [Streptomyces sp. 4F14]|uniref:4Fe-4S binding protein n=1 Tax=Streptomyces sp. 4F14 TaxID=3394380 RepID=UPI003A860B23
MGLHRNVIHPEFGGFVLVVAEVSEYGRALGCNPCIDCKLCVAACPVGAIAQDGSFDEFMSGFTERAQSLSSPPGYTSGYRLAQGVRGHGVAAAASRRGVGHVRREGRGFPEGRKAAETDRFSFCPLRVTLTV